MCLRKRRQIFKKFHNLSHPEWFFNAYPGRRHSMSLRLKIRSGYPERNMPCTYCRYRMDLQLRCVHSCDAIRQDTVHPVLTSWNRYVLKWRKIILLSDGSLVSQNVIGATYREGWLSLPMGTGNLYLTMVFRGRKVLCASICG